MTRDTLTMPERIARLDSAIAEGRILRGAWRKQNGVERVCLLAAISPECAKKESASACPAEVCPAWWAELTPWIDDNGSIEKWPGVIRQYASFARRWHSLSVAQWKRLEYRVKVIILDEAVSHITTDKWGVRAACERVRALLIAAANESTVAVADFAAARAAAGAAAWAAAEAAEVAAEAAAEAARAAAGAAAWAAAGAAAEAAADRITAAIFAAMELELSFSEAA